VKREGRPAQKVFVEKIGEEPPQIFLNVQTLSEVQAICWSYGRTLGNIAAFSSNMIGHFPAQSGSDAVLPCDFIPAGKFRNGADRWWCKTHQSHWGTKADHESYDHSKVLACANRDQRLNYVISPNVLNVHEYAEVGIWCSLPAALSTTPIERRPPRIHVHVRQVSGGTKVIDRDFQAIAGNLILDVPTRLE
jgi:hypothetical protein